MTRLAENKPRHNGKAPGLRRSRGFNLIELMISLVLGLLLVGGVITVFVSNQTTYRTTTDLDNAQEAFRFASHTIMRVVRQAEEIQNSGQDGELLVLLSGSAGDGVRNCLGDEVRDADGDPDAVETQANQFLLAGEALRCDVYDDPGDISDTPDTTGDLVDGVSQLVFRYGEASDDYWNATDELEDYGSVDDWTDVRSVQVDMQMVGSGLSTEFMATVRQSAISAAAGGGDDDD
ncbi:PilW family protein [Thioalkalivibrio sp. ALE19]|uniref:PilW family protein n=1 Tax=Thioalkalivibrio sp. ALE19 TaxID=1266909 RepID=UPI00048ABA28|nr:PilW family protein [Thioalkalivibrio sp. ALE19]